MVVCIESVYCVMISQRSTSIVVRGVKGDGAVEVYAVTSL